MHHIIIRGIELKAIFRDNTDRDSLHLNPLRAKVVKDVKDLGLYRWCGHSVLMGKAEADFQDTEYVLKSFGQSVRQARWAYESFVAKGVKHGRLSDLVGGGLLRSVGGWAELKEFRDLGIAVRKLGYKCSDVSKAMGISAVTVSKAVNLGSELSEVDKIQKQMLDN